MDYHKLSQSEYQRVRRVLALHLYQKRLALRGRYRTFSVNNASDGIIFSSQSLLSPTKRLFLTIQQCNQVLINTILFFTRPFVFPLRYYPLHTIILLTIFGIIWGLFYKVNVAIFVDLPDPNLLSEQLPYVSSKITDRHGSVLYRLYDEENRTLIPLREISNSVIEATIAIEDKDFWHHHGFSLRAIIRAALSNSQSELTQGGSTITQQLVKNRLLSPERTIQRKIKEVLLSVMTEQRYSKETILTMYLNQVPYGGSTYGIEEAAQRYFGKSASKLDLAESALLAGLPAAPTAYTPYGNSPERAFARQREVLRNMVEAQYITQDEAAIAAQQQLAFRQDSIDIIAPHFVMYVKNELAKTYGENILNRGGLTIKTTLDVPTQMISEKVIEEELTKLAKLKVSNGAALVTNPQTGEILAMVGSKNYFDFANDGQVNVTLRPRQPGSSIKPITYTLAFENGFTPASTIVDAPISFTILGSEPYSPKNYDGTYHGPVTLRQALASSYNVPAVKLLSVLGVNNLISLAEQMGITTWQDRSRFGLSLTLGGGEVTMIDMVTAYGTLANNGQRVEINPILEVTDLDGKILYNNICAQNPTTCHFPQVIPSGIAYQVTHILKDPVARIPAFGPFSVLTIPGQEVAVKTGTTNNLRDNWTIGYTSERVVATWVGNNDNTSMSYVASGITGASPIWNKIIRTQLSAEKPHVFQRPDSIISMKSCFTNQEEVIVVGQPLPPPCNKQLSEQIDTLIEP